MGRGQRGGLRRARELDRSYLRDTLAVLAAEKDGPGDAAGVLALEEERLGLAVLEAEDLAVATDVDLTLYSKRKSMSAVCAWFPKFFVCVMVMPLCRSRAMSSQDDRHPTYRQRNSESGIAREGTRRGEERTLPG